MRNKDIVLNIPIYHLCNQNCIFCSEGDKSDHKYLKGNEDKYIYKLIKDGIKDSKSLIFTTGEPTLNKNLHLYIKFAKDLGYERIGLVTNGSLMNNDEIRNNILNSGLTQIIFSIHGSNSIIHDYNTQIKGSFNKAFLGLMMTLKEGKNIDIYVSFVLNKTNLNDLYVYIKKFYLLGVKKILINTIRPEGYGQDNYLKYGFHYDKFIEYIKKLTKQQLELVNNLVKLDILNIMDIPVCIIKQSGLDISSYGTIELRKTFDNGKQLIIDNTVKNEIDLENGKTYVNKCFKCKYNYYCEGFYVDYINNFSKDE
ncbi:radical SAM protein [Candidatus Gracilibacteria bacterium]|nr:radical SAM protein [Candidatus Gracilibacteria bacterium]